ncbi:MAG: hypothetical protein JO078_06660 [Candidatus Eremiobacteraeota bacterium]|nr:hypothetical protein [Candidatus Eremiobacteraeota bacterium]MBV9055439.1 hypothetical protein [Candidatus Eremiobacteraeota bacterium]MBV9699788.1 hypothetical protein [Candidatus Eremiobacteraeota bacterium]
MAKYLILSTAIVFGVAVIAAGWFNRDLIRVKIAGVYARAHSKGGAFSGSPAHRNVPLSGDAPWALSALPECLRQLSKSSGSVPYVRAHLPRDAVAIAPPATLVFGDCTIAIDDDEAYVRRGSDRLRIPPRVRFYRAPGMLALIRDSGGIAELRLYQPAAQ